MGVSYYVGNAMLGYKYAHGLQKPCTDLLCLAHLCTCLWQPIYVFMSSQKAAINAICNFFFSLPLFAIISPGIMTTGSVLELAGFMDIVTSGLHHIAFKFDVANVPKKMVRHLAISII